VRGQRSRFEQDEPFSIKASLTSAPVT
jgi:hypothetical protein